jgi:two-component system chemotaxis response regulator CheY
MQVVLIVDDDVDSRDAMHRYFEKSGYKAQCVPNGQEAIVALGKGIPSAIILDWMMPKMDGIQFLEIIRCYLNWQQVPVILVTGYEGPHIAKARALGVDSVFLKGRFELADLLECVKRAGHRCEQTMMRNNASISH